MTWGFDGVTLAVEFGYGSGPFTDPASVTWVDETTYVRSMTLQSTSRSTEVDDFQPGMAQIELSNRTRRFDPAYGPASMEFTGNAGTNWGCGDLAAFAGATELDVRAAIALDDWTPASASAIVSQWGAAGQRSWLLAVDTSGYLTLTTSGNGTATASTDSGCQVSAVNGQLVCVRVTWAEATGDTNYYVKRTTPARARLDCLDHDGWVQLGVTEAGGTDPLFNATAAVTFGSTAGGASAFDGKVYYCDARTTIGSDTLVFGFWPHDAASASATSWVASEGAGETWTATGTSYAITLEGALYGQLVPGVPVRVRATYSATTYDLWHGYVRRWPNEYARGGVDATVTVSALDALGWLATMPAPSTAYGMTIPSTDAYWPLHEPVPGTAFADAHGTAHGSWLSPGEAGVSLPPGGPAPTRQLSSNPATAPDLASIPDAPGINYSPTLMFWVHLESSSSTFRVFAKGGNVCLGICYGVGGNYYLHGQYDGAVSWSVPIVGRLEPGSYHVSLSDTGGAFAGMFVNLFGSIGLGAETTAVVDTTNAAGLYIDGYLASVSDVSFGEGAAGDVDVYAAGANGRALETAGERMTWLLTAAGIPAALQDVTTDPSTFLGPSSAGSTFGALCKQVETAEAGRLFVAGDGKITFRSRVWATTATAATTVQATFDDTFVGVVVDPANIDDLTNSASVSIASGAAGTYRDADSIALYGEASVSKSAPLPSTGDAANLARHLVGTRAHPSVRVEQLELKPRGNPATMFPQVFGREIGERIRVKRRPTDTLIPSVTTEPIAADVTIEGIRHQVTADDWVTVWNTAPAPATAQEAGYLTADDTVLGVIDSGVTVPY